MSHVEDHNDDNYAGPSKAIEMLGKGNAYGWIGSIGGAIVGGLWAASATKETSEDAQRLTKWLGKRNIHISGKTAIVAAGALATSQIVHWATYFIGLGHGKKTSGKGQEQFARLKAQRDDARNEIESLKVEREALVNEIKMDHGKGIHDGSTPNNVVMADGLQAQTEAAQQIAR